MVCAGEEKGGDGKSRVPSRPYQHSPSAHTKGSPVTNSPTTTSRYTRGCNPLYRCRADGGGPDMNLPTRHPPGGGLDMNLTTRHPPPTPTTTTGGGLETNLTTP